MLTWSCRGRKSGRGLAVEPPTTRAVKLPVAPHPNPPRSSPPPSLQNACACSSQFLVPDPFSPASMSRRYDSRVCSPRGSRRQPTTNASIDDHLLARGPLVPGRICARGYFARRNRAGNLSKRWHRIGSREEGHQQAAGAGHIRREAVHPERVRATPRQHRKLH